jgi:Holliday junction resolvase RusA-like endonuclease
MTHPAITIDMPLPPSANHLFVNLKGGGRAKSVSYKAWINEARYHVLTQWRAAGKPEWPADLPMQLHVALGLENRKRDATNCAKAIEDILVRELPVPDDRWNDFISIKRDLNIPGMARVTLAPLDTT